MPLGGRVKVAPNVSGVGAVTITSKYFTIWKSSGTKIVSKKTSAWLSAGSYKVTTTVTWKVKKRSGGYYPSKTTTRTQPLVVAISTATCATTDDTKRVKTGDSKTVVSWKLYSAGSLEYADGNHEDWRYALCGNRHPMCLGHLHRRHGHRHLSGVSVTATSAIAATTATVKSRGVSARTCTCSRASLLRKRLVGRPGRSQNLIHECNPRSRGAGGPQR